MYSHINVVSVDDFRTNLNIIEKMSKKLGIKTISFQSSVEALDYIKNNAVDIVITDYNMPDLDGMDLVKAIREFSKDIAIVMITSMGENNDLKLSALKEGVNEFLNRPFNEAEFIARITNLANLIRYQSLLKNKVLLLQDEVNQATQNIVLREKETINVLGKVSEYRDKETAFHLMRVASYSKLISEALGDDEKIQDIIFNSAPLHDVGKIGIQDCILLKPGKLTDEEFNIMKQHTIIGYDMLKNTKSPYLEAGAIIALTHHEKWDGTGYPYGLKGEDIHKYGRITAIADVFDALTSKRPYKDPWPFEKAIELLIKEKGKHFDPLLVDCFTDDLKKIYKIYKTYADK